MTKKNRKKSDHQNGEQEIPRADERPIETNQSENEVEQVASVGSENQVEANQAEPKVEPETPDPEVQEEIPVENSPTAAAEENGSKSQDESIDDILADVRHSLIEEDEAGKSGKKSSWWNRLVKGPSGQEVSPSVSKDVEEIKDASTTQIPSSAEPVKEESEEFVEEIDELIKLLETDSDDDQNRESAVPVPVPPPVVEEIKIDIDELKKQAFSARPEENTPEEVSDVRTVALGGEEDVFVEVEAKTQDPWEERFKATENALRPYRTYIYYGLAFIGVIMAVMASVIIYNGVKQALPTPVVTEAANLPYPVTVSLPGGLNFNLAKGALKDGSWKPAGPEWLEGTEICRWVALPWSRQLEAAVRTMTRDDVIDLYMSNNDKFSYTVISIQELTLAELQEMDSSSPCVAVILAKQDSEKRWVAIGKP